MDILPKKFDIVSFIGKVTEPLFFLGSKFAAPYEAIFLLPEPICKSCGTRILPEKTICHNCNKTFKHSFLENVFAAAIMVHVDKEDKKREAAYKLADFNSRRQCKKHGFQKTITLPKDGKEIVCCIHCLAEVMATPIRCGGKDYKND
jgi:RNA polymerase subunit RPABC4/transcription elongation factor Spt4